MIRCATLVAVALAGCASAPPEPTGAAASAEAALVSVAVMRGFAAPVAEEAAPRVVALLDASATMWQRAHTGVGYFEAARTSASRWFDALPEETTAELRVLGGVRGAGCATRTRVVAGTNVSRDVWLGALEGLSPSGEGSLAEGLLELAAELPESNPTPLRVVAWSALRDTCGASLCEAARELARRGGHLDLVVLGNAPVPECLAEIEASAPSAPLAATRRPVGFRVERLGREPAVVGCSEAGGLPVAVAPGTARIVVGLEPPLSLERSFAADSRWALEIVDFPALDPPLRHWRWRPLKGKQPEDAP